MQPYKDPRAGLQLDNWMRHAGFAEVGVTSLRLPLSGWPNGSLSHTDTFKDISDPKSIQMPITEELERQIVPTSTDCWRHWRYIHLPKARGMFDRRLEGPVLTKERRLNRDLQNDIG